MQLLHRVPLSEFRTEQSEHARLAWLSAPLLRSRPVLGAEIRPGDRATATPVPLSAKRSLAPRREVVRIAGERMYLWRTIDHEGEVLDMLVQRRRDTRAALRLMRKLLKKQGFAPKLLVTDKLRSYAWAFRSLRLTCPHEQGLAEEQSNRKLASAGAPARAQNAAVQVGLLRSAFSQHARRRSQHLQPSAPSRVAVHAPDLSSRGGEPIARCGRGRLIVHRPPTRLLAKG